MSRLTIFHLAIPINDVTMAKKFYAEALGCIVGRENKSAVIFNFFGTQLVGHITQKPLMRKSGIYPHHLGLILTEKKEWEDLRDRAVNQNLTFYQRPKLRFPHQNLEHHTFFLEDPFYNLLEFKYYRNYDVIFGGKESDLIGDVSPSDS